MADVLTSEQRRHNMQAIRGRDTKPEMIVRRIVHRLGYRFRLHRRDLPGRPDIVLPRLRRAILVHGCFWHRHAKCRYAATPRTRGEYWLQKLQVNVYRDRVNKRRLERLGWQVLVVWECQLKDTECLTERLRSFLDDGRPGGLASTGAA